MNEDEAAKAIMDAWIDKQGGRVSIPDRWKPIPIEQCDLSVHRDGTAIMITGDIPKDLIENIIQAIRPHLKDGVKLDWHYVGGRAVWKILDRSDQKTQEPDPGVFAQNHRSKPIAKTE